MSGYQIGDQVREPGFDTVGTITEIRPLGFWITGDEPTVYVRVRPGLDHPQAYFEARVADGTFVIVKQEEG